MPSETALNTTMQIAVKVIFDKGVVLVFFNVDDDLDKAGTKNVCKSLQDRG